MQASEPPSVELEEMNDTAKLMRFCQLIIELDNKRLAAEAEAEAERKQVE